jgi:L-seryl-tRNA(Ser) seleniumtransferase
MNDLRKLPSVHALMNDLEMREWRASLSYETVVRTVREALKTIRKEIRLSKSNIEPETLRLRILKELKGLEQPSFERVINATGILIHTNLGRAPLSESALRRALELGKSYCTVEYNLSAGKRGERNDPIEKLLCQITGAEAGLVVNNNAAAVLLGLDTFAKGRHVLVSRGELVEIGNSFRIPEILEKSGAFLKGVGTTNKTKIRDSEKGIDKNTALILKVHKSNYDIVGFTEEVSLESLASLSHRKKLPLIFDAGSGLLLSSSHSLYRYFEGEPSIISSVKQGVDMITFSGDKLMGGPQCGMIVGKRKYIEKMKRSPLYRALRADKILLAILDETLRHYLSAEPEKEIPFLKLLATPVEILEARALSIQSVLKEHGVETEVKRDVSKIGGGSCPRLELPTVVLSIRLKKSVKEGILDVHKKLRMSKDPSLIPVVGRTRKDSLHFDFRTIFERDLSEFKNSLIAAL